MAKPKTAAWYKMLIQVGDGGSPEVFSAPCGLTTRGINFSAETSDTTVPDCDNPSLPSWTERVARALSGSISGSGVLALDAHDVWRDWFMTGEARNCRLKLDVPAADGGGHYAGRFILTTFNLGASEDDGKISVEVELQSDGEITWVDES